MPSSWSSDIEVTRAWRICPLLSLSLSLSLSLLHQLSSSSTVLLMQGATCSSVYTSRVDSWWTVQLTDEREKTRVSHIKCHTDSSLSLSFSVQASEKQVHLSWHNWRKRGWGVGGSKLQGRKEEKEQKEKEKTERERAKEKMSSSCRDSIGRADWSLQSISWQDHWQACYHKSVSIVRPSEAGGKINSRSLSLSLSLSLTCPIHTRGEMPRSPTGSMVWMARFFPLALETLLLTNAARCTLLSTFILYEWMYNIENQQWNSSVHSYNRSHCTTTWERERDSATNITRDVIHVTSAYFFVLLMQLSLSLSLSLSSHTTRVLESELERRELRERERERRKSFLKKGPSSRFSFG